MTPRRVSSGVICLLLLFIMLVGCNTPAGDPGTTSPITQPPVTGGPGTESPITQPLSDPIAQVVFKFSEIDSQQRAVAFHSISFLDDKGHTFKEILFGTTEANDLLEDGWLGTENIEGIGKAIQ